MVGLLIQIGLGKKNKDCIKEILKEKNRSQGFRTAHPEGCTEGLSALANHK